MSAIDFPFSVYPARQGKWVRGGRLGQCGQQVEGQSIITKYYTCIYLDFVVKFGTIKKYENQNFLQGIP